MVVLYPEMVFGDVGEVRGGFVLFVEVAGVVDDCAAGSDAVVDFVVVQEGEAMSHVYYKLVIISLELKVILSDGN